MLVLTKQDQHSVVFAILLEDDVIQFGFQFIWVETELYLCSDLWTELVADGPADGGRGGRHVL